MPGSSPDYAFLCRRCILAQAALVVDEISTRICEITVLERLHICALSSARWEELLDYYDFFIVALTPLLPGCQNPQSLFGKFQ